MNNIPHIIHRTEIKPGDILLCCASQLGTEARDRTGCSYSHTAIALENESIADSSVRGVRVTNIDKLFAEYEHLVVLRQPDGWDSRQLAALKDFVEKAIQAEAKFNFDGLRSFEAAREQHQNELHKKIVAFFNHDHPSPDPVRATYFCSEFVAACCIATGFIGSSGAVVFDPAFISPATFERDRAFGFFEGYVVPDSEYKIPNDDEFRRETPFSDI
jgi:hypothetical protein